MEKSGQPVDTHLQRHQSVPIMPWYSVTGIVLGALLLVSIPVVIWLVPWLRRSPRQKIIYGALFRFGQGFFWLIHRYRGDGLEHRPQTRRPGKLLVVCNHSGSIDPFLVQFVCPFYIRWLTAANTVPWLFRPFVNYLGVLNISRMSPDTAGLRQAIRLLNDDQVLGIFPEGKIAVPPRQIGPFARGVGYLVKKTQSPVLLVWISGTPDTNKVLPSLLGPSHSSITFVDYLEFDPALTKLEIAQQLRERLHQASGWPLREDVQQPDKMHQ